MALIKVICLFFGFLFLVNPFSTIYAKNNIENVPFDVEQVIEQVTTQQNMHQADNRLRFRKNQDRMTENLQGEFMIDTAIIYGPAYDEQFTPSVAFDGANYFVVWGEDEFRAVVGTRVSPTGEVLDSSGIKIAEGYVEWEEGPSVAFGENYLVVWVDRDYGDIYGTRVSTAGVVLDTTPIAICTTDYEPYQPSVTFGLSNFLVVWVENRNNFDIYGARVNTNGIVLDPSGIPIVTAFEDQDEPAVSFDGTNYFIVWSDERSDTSRDIYGARVDTAGMVLDSAGIPISTAPDWQVYPAVTFGGGNFFVTWQDWRNMTSRHVYKVRRTKANSDLFKYKDELDSLSSGDIYGARVSTDGTVLDDTGIPISTEDYRQEWPQVAFDGINYFAVWQDWRIRPSSIYGARINTAGIVLDPNGIKICTTSVGSKYFPSVVWGGTNYFVAWEDTRSLDDIFGTPVTTAGSILDPAGILVSISVNTQERPQMAFDGTNYLVVWQDFRSGYPDIYGTRISSNGAILDPIGIPISTAPYRQKNPKVIFGGNGFFVIWEDYRNREPYYSDIYGTRVSSYGVVLDTAGIPISTASDRQYSAQVVFGGDYYFVVWQDERGSGADIYGARVSNAGIVLDPDGISISTENAWQWAPQVVCDGSNYFVVWRDCRNISNVYGSRVSNAGVVLDPTGIQISTASSGDPQIVFSGNYYFVVWGEARTGDYGDIYGSRVTTEGVVLDTGGVPISTASNHQYSPKVVFDSTEYFVVWEDYRAGGYGFEDIYGARVTTEGIVLDTTGIPIAIADRRQANPQIVFDGTNYVVVWEDYRNWGLSYIDVYGALVNTSGIVTDTFSVSTQPEFQGYPALALGSANQVLITYQGWTDTVMSKVYNTMRIWGKFAPAPGIEETKISADINSPIFMNSPNPFNRSTLIKYSVRKSGEVSIKIYDIAGKLVRNLVNDNKKPGTYSIRWNGTDDSGRKLPAGVYFYQLEREDNSVITKELILLR